MSHGAEAAAGIPVVGRKIRLTSAEPTTISVVVESGSRPTLISAFHPAWQSAANSTARKTAFSNGYDGLLIEVPAGVLDDADPEARIRSEVEEEIGYRLGDVQLVFETFMSPGSVTERLHLFIAEYDATPGVPASCASRYDSL